MPAPSVSLRCFILSLLTRQPMSGYDVKRFLRSLSWLMGSPSSGSLYPILRALLEGGLVTVDVVVRQDRPPRKIYTITQAGKRALQEWMEQLTPSGTLKSFVMRLILANNLSRRKLLAHLEHRRSEVARHQNTIGQNVAAMGDKTDLGLRLTLDYGLAIARSELTWLDTTLERLLHDSEPGQAVEGNLLQGVVPDVSARSRS